jgi:protein-S-isoprenylcysteine O-methyltransferase Ste14
MAPLFPSAFEGVIFWFVFLFGMAVSSIIEERGAQQSLKSRKANGDKSTLPALNTATFFSLAASILLGYARVIELPRWSFLLGLAMYLFGIAYAFWAAITLGRLYAPTVQVQFDHRVIEKGPYRFIRHPRYAGGLLAFLGIGLALQSWAAVLTLLSVMGLGYAYRIRVEERFLIAELGNDYIEYCKRTKRIIPLIL